MHPPSPCTFPGFPVENPDMLDCLTLLWKKPTQCCLLARLKKEHGNLAQIEVDKMLCFMCDIWTCSGINNGLFRRGSHDTDQNEEGWTDKSNYGRIGCLVWWVPFKSGETSLICSNLTAKKHYTNLNWYWEEDWQLITLCTGLPLTCPTLPLLAQLKSGATSNDEARPWHSLQPQCKLWPKPQMTKKHLKTSVCL